MIHKPHYHRSPSTFINYCFHLIRGYSDGIRLIWRVTASRHVRGRTRVHPFASDSSLRKPFSGLIFLERLSDLHLAAGIFVSLCSRLRYLLYYTHGARGEVSVGACEIRRAYHPKIKHEHKRIWRSRLLELARRTPLM